MQYSLRTQTTIDCGKSSFKSTFNHHSLQSSPCKQKHILQMPPKPPQIKTDDSNCINLLAKNFNQPAPNNVWVCDSVVFLPKTVIKGNAVIAEHSLVNKEFKKENILIAGIPAVIKKNNIMWHIDLNDSYKQSEYPISNKE